MSETMTHDWLDQMASDSDRVHALKDRTRRRCLKAQRELNQLSDNYIKYSGDTHVTRHSQ